MTSSSNGPPEALTAVMALRPPLATSTRTDLAPSFKLLRSLVDTVWGSMNGGGRGLDPGLWRRQLQRAAERAGALVGAVWEKYGGREGVMVDDEGEGGRGVMKMQGVLSDIQLFASSLASTTDPLSSLLLDSAAFQRTSATVTAITKKLAGLATHYRVVDGMPSPLGKWPEEDAEDRAEDMAALPILIAKSRPSKDVLRKFEAVVAEKEKGKPGDESRDPRAERPAQTSDASSTSQKPGSSASLTTPSSSRRLSSVPVKGGTALATSGLTGARRADFLRFVYSQNPALVPKEGGVEAAVAAAASVISQSSPSSRQNSLGLPDSAVKSDRRSLVQQRVASFGNTLDESFPVPLTPHMRRGASEGGAGVGGGLRKWSVDMSGIEAIQRRSSGSWNRTVATGNPAPRLSVSGPGVTWEAGKKKEFDRAAARASLEGRSSRSSSLSSLHQSEDKDKAPPITSFAEQAAAIVAERKRRSASGASSESGASWTARRPPASRAGSSASGASAPSGTPSPQPGTAELSELPQLARRVSPGVAKEPALSPVLDSPPAPKEVVASPPSSAELESVEPLSTSVASLPKKIVEPTTRARSPSTTYSVKSVASEDAFSSPVAVRSPTSPRLPQRQASIMSSSSKATSLSVPAPKKAPSRSPSPTLSIRTSSRSFTPSKPPSPPAPEDVITDLVDDASILDAISGPPSPKPSSAPDTSASPTSPAALPFSRAAEEPSLADLVEHASLFEAWEASPERVEEETRSQPPSRPSSVVRVASPTTSSSSPSTARAPAVNVTPSGPKAQKSTSPTVTSSAVSDLQRSPSMKSFSGMSWATSMMSAPPLPSEAPAVPLPSVGAGIPTSGSLPTLEGNAPMRILSIDGGGIRGLSSLFIIREIMETVRAQQGLPTTPRPCDCFDMICGAGTGGIIALLLGRLQMDVETAIDAYLGIARNVFGQGKGALAVLLGKTRYSASKLDAAVQDVVQSAGLASRAALSSPNSRCYVFVLAMRTSEGHHGSSRTLRSFQTRTAGADRCTIYQAARATSAAPLFFKPVEVDDAHLGSVPNNARLNNPASEAIDEAGGLFPDLPLACLVSVGAGRISPTGDKVTRACAEISASCEAGAAVLAARAASEGWEASYARFNVETGLDGLTKEWGCVTEVVEATKAYMHGREATEQAKAITKIIAASPAGITPSSSLHSALTSASPKPGLASLAPSPLASKQSFTLTADDRGKISDVRPSLSLENLPGASLTLHNFDSTASFHLPNFK